MKALSESVNEIFSLKSIFFYVKFLDNKKRSSFYQNEMQRRRISFDLGETDRARAIADPAESLKRRESG